MRKIDNEQQHDLAAAAEHAIARAKGKGAQQAAASARLSHRFRLLMRDGEQEQLKASVQRKLTVTLYVDGRYGSHSTSRLERDQIERFVDQALDLTRLLQPDEHRRLPEPRLYEGRAKAEGLGLFDPAQASVTMAQRKQRALRVHDAARAGAGDALISVAGGVSDSRSLWLLRTSNGFSDHQWDSSFWQWGTVSAKDPSGRRPSDYAVAGARRLAQLDDPAATGSEAAKRTLAMIGAGGIKSLKVPLIIENRAAGRLLGELIGPLFGRALDQQRSCFDEALGKAIASDELSLFDDPLLAGGWSTRRFDGEGITARRRPVIARGVLKSYFIDSYYGRKLERPPTSGSASNLLIAPGRKDLAAMCRAAGRAVLVTGLLGGNSNPTTGDFSHGIEGFLIEGGERARPLASMNFAGNHRKFWRRLEATGNDPYAHSSRRTPSLLFSEIVVAGK